MKTSIETIRSGLQTQLTEVEQELQTALDQVHQLRTTRRQVTAALRALGGTDGEEKSRPAPKKADVQTAVESLLKQNGGTVAIGDLEGLVTASLQGKGFSAVGLALRLREVMASDSFREEAGEVRSRAMLSASRGTTEEMDS